MIYRDFKGLKLSGLGLGCMRLPVLDGDEARVDYARAEQIIDYAYAHGVNYFDTAYAYHGGNSEAVIGRALAKYPRESFFLADKFPGYDRGNLGRIDEIFNEQLRRCGVDYFDFYLCHNVYEPDIDGYLAPEYGLLDYLAEQKRAGRIRHLGFSCHGALPVLERFLDAGGDRLEFCQIQLNYVDWSLQRAEEKVKLLNSRGVPVWVMEPVRGGKLASLPEGARAKLAALRPEESPAAWAFRFLQGVSGVTVVLSGMSTLEQVEENVRTWSEDKPLDEAEFEAALGVGRGLFTEGALPCTACRYCVSRCPQGLDIPELLRLYNDYVFSGPRAYHVINVIEAMPEEKRPAACIACGSCAGVCPQQLPIPETFAKLTELLAKEE